MLFVAEQMREVYVARLGFRTVEEMVGHPEESCGRLRSRATGGKPARLSALLVPASVPLAPISRR